MAIVILRYWAAAKEAAGVAEDKVSAQTLADALEAGLAAASERAGSGPDSRRLRLVFARSSFLIDGHPVGTRRPESIQLYDAAVIEILPPFAGG
jgi:sulfur-carrier protein